ncbi:MAG TPA: hypothetical protein VFQ13_08875 [Anaerolineales bacterium]|nr:hypothetical protein [Anaerolineales bacterium]
MARPSLITAIVLVLALLLSATPAQAARDRTPPVQPICASQA